MQPRSSSPLLQNQAPLGIKLAGASGDIKSAREVSSTKLRDTPYVPSPSTKASPALVGGARRSIA
ncbi:hypothetical protein N9W62_04165 [Akkermansiaceae bacterium]|nr:hypothetical protein [Akkermansiaceae bacterium]